MTVGKIVFEGEVDQAFLRDLAAVQRALGEAREEAEKVGQVKPPTGLDRLRDSLRGVGEAARNFNELREAVSSAAEGLVGTAERVADLAAQQQRLTANSTRLGLDFQRAAQQAGGFVTEMQTMTLATSLANRNINVTQRELDALARVGMARAVDAGKNVEEVFDSIADSIVEGGEELEKFGSSLHSVADDSHTASERLSALAGRGREIGPAMRTAADQLSAFRAEMERTQRVIATEFIAEWQRLSDLGAPLRSASTDAEELNRDLQAVGQTAARLAAQIGRGVGSVAGGTATLGAWIGEQLGLVDRETTNTLARFTADQARALNAMDDDARARTSAPVTSARSAAPTRSDLVVTPEEIGIDPRTGRRLRAGASRGGGAAANDNAARMTPEEQRRLAAGLSPLGGALAGAIDEAAAPFDGNVEALRRAQEQDRALSAAQNQRADAAAAAGRARTQPGIDRMASEQERDKQRSEDFRAQEIHQRAVIDRENAYLEERLRVQESFSEQWERLHRRQANATTASVEMANTAVAKFGQAFGQHVNLILSGQESVGEGVLNMVTDVVTALGQEAIVKAAMETAEGVAAAAGVYTAPLAPGHFAAAAAFAAVGAAALGAGALIGAARGGGASATPAAPALPPPTQADAAASQGQSITIVYGAGILGSPRDLARHVRDVLVEGEQGGVRIPARVMEAA